MYRGDKGRSLMRVLLTMEEAMATAPSTAATKSAIVQALLPEFDQEMVITRRVLERVPDEKFGWKPHEKSGTMGWLAGHVATLPRLATIAITQDSVDMATAPKPPKANNRAELLSVFDSTAAEARKAIAGATDETLMKVWSLQVNGKTLMSLPKAAAVRGFFMN